MQRKLLTILVVLALATAGCLGGGGDDGPEATSADGGGSGPGDDGGPGGDDGSSDDDPANATATLAEPPTWEPGDWWEVEVESSELGETNTVTRVVADQVGDDHRVGMPADDFNGPVVLAHFPGVGNVRTSDLSFLVHNERFQPLQFPLEEGDSWETTLYTGSVTVTVDTATNTTATLTYDWGGNSTTEGTYDAEVGALTSFTGPIGTRYEVTDAGDGFEGTVKVPHDRVQFVDGRIAGAVDTQLQPAPPTGSLEVPSSAQEAVGALIVGGIPVGPVPGAGAYHEAATSPAGEEYSATTTGELMFDLFLDEDPAGTWDLQHVAGGFGVAGTELITYQVQLVDLGG